MKKPEETLAQLFILSETAGHLGKPYRVKRPILKELERLEWICLDNDGGFRFTGSGMAIVHKSAREYFKK